MAARGILANPSMFLGSDVTPLACVQDWVNISMDFNTTFNCFHHHLVFMLEHVLPKEERRIFNSLKTKSNVLEFLQEKYELCYEPGKSGFCVENDVIVCDISSDREDKSCGSYFTSAVQRHDIQDEVLDCLGGLYN